MHHTDIDLKKKKNQRNSEIYNNLQYKGHEMPSTDKLRFQ